MKASRVWMVVMIGAVTLTIAAAAQAADRTQARRRDQTRSGAQVGQCDQARTRDRIQQRDRTQDGSCSGSAAQDRVRARERTRKSS